MRLCFAPRLLPAILATMSYPGLSLATTSPRSSSERMDRKLVAEPTPQEIYFSGNPVTKATKTGTWNPDNIQGSLDQWTWNSRPHPSIPEGSGRVNNIDIGDIDGDGLWDVCVVQQSWAHDRKYQPRIMYGNGVTELLTPAIIGTQSGRLRECVIGDVNGDGQLDIIISGSENHPLRLCLYNGQGFDECQNISPGNLVLVRPGAVKIDDFNNDGLPDVIAATYSGIDQSGVYVWINQGPSGWTSVSQGLASRMRIPLPDHSDWGTLALNNVQVGDVNNDGLKDVVICPHIHHKNERKVLLYLNNGMNNNVWSGFRPPQKLSHPNGYHDVYTAVIADFNGDNRPDIVVGVSHHDIYNWLMINKGGDGVWWDVADGFPTYVNVSPTDKGASTLDIAAVDIDGDGDMDMVWGKGHYGSNAVIINTGSADADGNGLFDPTYYRLGPYSPWTEPSKVIVVGSTTPGSPPPPTQAPTQAPTAPGPLTLDYDHVEANFTSGASNELEVGFFVGVGHAIDVKVFETCDKEANEVLPPTLYNKNGGAMVHHVPGSANATHSKIIVGYNFDKAQMINSSLWNSTSEVLTFCQVTSLTIPDPSDPNGDAWVILSDRREIKIQFDLDANFEVDVALDDRTINNETETISFNKDVEAYKCRGGDGNSFVPERGALPPNVWLNICIRVRNNTSVNIDRLSDMTIAQDGKTPFGVVNDGVPLIGDLTKMPDVSEGVIVKTRVPVNQFDFESGKSLNISGTVDLELATNRKLRALAGENDAAGEGREKAGYDVTVSLQSTADGFGPIGSSDGHAIVDKGLAVLGLVVVGLAM